MTNRRYPLVGPLFVLPAVAGLILFVLFPFILAFILSLTNFRFGTPLSVEFVGLSQYARIFQDGAFQRALLNNCVFALIVVPSQTLFALVLALLLIAPMRGLKLFRTMFFMPVVFPLSLVSVIWILLFAPGQQGFINHLLSTTSLGHWDSIDFLHHPKWALGAIMLTSIWQGTGFQMVILMAGLQSIPQQLYDAARIDGAGCVAELRHITLPQLRPALTFVVLITTILSFRLFDQVQIMTKGGPLNASTTIMYESVTRAFTKQQVATASAMTVILFLIILLTTMLQARLNKLNRRLA